MIFTQFLIVSIKFMHLNSTSLDNKLNELKAVVETYHPGIIAVSQTWFKVNR